jgi:hypothetical protein
MYLSSAAILMHFTLEFVLMFAKMNVITLGNSHCCPWNVLEVISKTIFERASRAGVREVSQPG